MLEYNEAMVRRKLNQLYPSREDREIAKMLLSQIVSNSVASRYRVRLCVLKLADGDLELLDRYVNAALRDSRDVMLWAQYPEEGKRRMRNLPEEEKAQVRARDELQFQDWLDHGDTE